MKIFSQCKSLLLTLFLILPTFNYCSAAEKDPAVFKYFEISKDARVVRNYHNDSDPGQCTSLEFKATIINKSDKKRAIYTSFFLKDAQGYVLETDNGFYEIDGDSGTREPRVLKAFSSWHDFSCEEVKSIELRISDDEDDVEVSMSLPIVDNK